MYLSICIYKLIQFLISGSCGLKDSEVHLGPSIPSADVHCGRVSAENQSGVVSGFNCPCQLMVEVLPKFQVKVLLTCGTAFTDCIIF